MPNHCASRLTVNGPTKELARFGQGAMHKTGNETEAFDITALLPEPREFDDVVSGGCIIAGKQHSA